MFLVQNGLKQDALLPQPVIFALDSALGSSEKPAGTELIGTHELLVYAIDVNYWTSFVHIKELTINKQGILCIFSCFNHQNKEQSCIGKVALKTREAVAELK